MTNIVMVVKDRLRLTQQALESLASHTNCNDYTLCLVDDNSQDFRVRKLLHETSLRPNVTFIRIEKSAGVVARAKNIGAAWSRQTFGEGAWLYFTDNDTYFKAGWLPTLVEYATGGEDRWNVKLVGGQSHPFHHAESDGSLSVLDGPSWLLRWSTWEKYGPFPSDCAPGTCQSEEYPVCNRIREAGGKIWSIDPPVVIHTGLTNTKGEKAPGYEERKALMEPGVVYE